MADTVAVIFSLVALVCGVITLYWILRLKHELPMQMQGNYLTSALVAISFLVSFPLWNLFVDMFDFASQLVKQVSYLFFSLGYFGVLLVAHASVKGVEGMKGKVKTLNKEVKKRKSIESWLNRKD
ncbi:hypothetical protein D6777_04205 [Candidatus Woesearchaeota archaeon]|nr:MAG: hypothetical protein D6777_04205 [Candidatus Woesearchaeota archaeon]